MNMITEKIDNKYVCRGSLKGIKWKQEGLTREECITKTHRLLLMLDYLKDTKK